MSCKLLLIETDTKAEAFSGGNNSLFLSWFLKMSSQNEERKNQEELKKGRKERNKGRGMGMKKESK